MVRTADTLIIDRRFRGPPNSGNGGYVCGRVARVLEGPVEVTLLKPPPLDVPLEVVRTAEGAELRHGETVVAAAVPKPLDLDVPPPPHHHEAEEAAKHYRGFSRHPFPACFVCGPERSEEDGLRIFAGAVEGAEGLVAAPWYSDETLADADGCVRPEFLWAALDCPGYAAISTHAETAVLGRLHGSVERRLQAGEAVTVMAWPLFHDGRKHGAATAVFDLERRLVARAKAVWIAVDPKDFSGTM